MLFFSDAFLNLWIKLIILIPIVIEVFLVRFRVIIWWVL